MYIYIYMGGCQNYGPFLGTLNTRCREFPPRPFPPKPYTPNPELQGMQELKQLFAARHLVARSKASSHVLGSDRLSRLGVSLIRGLGFRV